MLFLPRHLPLHVTSNMPTSDNNCILCVSCAGRLGKLNWTYYLYHGVLSCTILHLPLPKLPIALPPTLCSCCCIPVLSIDVLKLISAVCYAVAVLAVVGLRLFTGRVIGIRLAAGPLRRARVGNGLCCPSPLIKFPSPLAISKHWIRC